MGTHKVKLSYSVLKDLECLNDKVKEKPSRFFKDINNDYIQEMVFIKTSKFYYSNFNKQAIFYSFILNSCKEELRYTDLKNICFAIFLSKFDRLIPITKFSNVDEIHSDFDNIVNNLIYIYKSVFGMDGITLEGIKFIHDNVEERDKETIDLIRNYITEDNCRFCVLKDNCPIINNP